MGSLPEASTYRGSGLLTNVRTGQHACFDRIVFDVKGKPSWFRVQYVKDVSTVGRARLPFRVFTLTGQGTSRIVVDVAHRW